MAVCCFETIQKYISCCADSDVIGNELRWDENQTKLMIKCLEKDSSKISIVVKMTPIQYTDIAMVRVVVFTK